MCIGKFLVSSNISLKKTSSKVVECFITFISENLHSLGEIPTCLGLGHFAHPPLVYFAAPTVEGLNRDI